MPIGSENLMSVAGCDSIVSINLEFNDILAGSEEYSGCQGDGYFVVVNGNIYNEAMPIGSENLMSVAGCDSIVSINLEFNDILAGSEEYSGCQGDGYFVVVNGNIYNEAIPIGSENLMSVAGCDSIVSINLEFNDILAGSEEYSGCQGDGYFVVVNGNIYNEAMPIGSENLMSVAGCDSIVSINLEFNDILAGSEEYSGCQGDGYFVVVNGNIYNEAMPIGSENLMSVAGCDSIVSINLEFNDILAGSEEYSGCQGDGYFVVVNGNIYNEAMPIGSENLMSVAGCDSIVSINLEFNDILAGSEEYSGCQGDGYFVVVNGNIYNEAMPIGSENLMSVAGCDSIVSINLEFNDILAGSEEYSGCQGDGYFVVVNGNIYNEAMPIGSENLMSVAGCDSIVSINLEFNDILAGSEEYSGCQGDGYFVVVNGNIYNEAMPIGSENLMSVAGCDSIVSINLEFNDILAGSEEYSGCQGDGYFVVVNGNIYNEAMPIGSENLMSVAGCEFYRFYQFRI